MTIEGSPDGFGWWRNLIGLGRSVGLSTLTKAQGAAATDNWNAEKARTTATCGDLKAVRPAAR